MDIIKQIFTAETTTAATEKKEDKMVVETTVTQETVRPVKEGVTYTKEVQCQPQKEIERIREIEIGTPPLNRCCTATSMHILIC
jgi:hypothetical protein